MSVTALNYINLGLIAASLAAALVAPFELLLLAYAVLGPLHYLTEISWLHDRGYYLPNSRDWIPLWTLGFAAAVFLPGIFGRDPIMLQVPWLGKLLFGWRFDIAFLAFSVALVLVSTRQWVLRLVYLALVVLILSALRDEPTFIRLFAAYLPSVVHVGIFTGLFLLLGALKGRNPSGYLTFAAFLAAGLTAYVAPGVERVAASAWARENFPLSFGVLTSGLLTDFGVLLGGQAYRIDPFEHPKSIAVVRVLGFIYVYHYLNWFSKTSIIKWHLIPASRYAFITVFWAASVGLYVLDYALGLSWLFLLSFGHFVLELPLNHRSVHGIATELRSRLVEARAA